MVEIYYKKTNNAAEKHIRTLCREEEVESVVRHIESDATASVYATVYSISREKAHSR